MIWTVEGDEARFRGAIPKAVRDCEPFVAYLRRIDPTADIKVVCIEKVRESFAQRRECGDQYDILYNGKRIEHKKREILFRDKYDFLRRGWDTILVDRRDKVDAHPADLYVSVSEDFRYAALIWTDETRHKWVVRPHYDHVKGHREYTYDCPVRYVEFEKISED